MAADEVMPLHHTEKMLGFIAKMLAEYLGIKFRGGDMTLDQLCMPWVGDQTDQTDQFLGTLGG